MSTSWRDRARPIVADVITTVGRQDMPALRRALRDAYPFGERAHWPYRVWCDEVRRQIGRQTRRLRPLQPGTVPLELEGQGLLFEDDE